ncbi:hypothetical protein N9X53_07485 [Mariniblastus sp.]|nr:hypothetical protein [Mariniblastus sp.]
MIGCLACFLAWTGVSQLAEIASPTFNGSMDEFPIVQLVWEFFAPGTGTVVVAKVASRVQSAFLIGAMLGLVMIVIGLFRLYRAFTRATNGHAIDNAKNVG